MALLDATFARRTLLLGTAATVGGALLRPGAAQAGGRLVAAHSNDSAARWVRTAYDVVARQGLTPPSAARVYAMVSVAVYEALLGGMPHLHSAQGQLSELGGLPRPAAPGLVSWPLVVGAAAGTVLHGLLPAMTPGGRAAVEAASLLDTEAGRASGTPDRSVVASRAHGVAVANAVLRWASTDGHAEAMAAAYTPPVGPSLWVPTPPNFGTAIEPFCHRVRPLLLRSTDEVKPVDPVPFSAEPGSPFWEQAMGPYRQSQVNGAREIDIARFWTDNPLFSGLPAGHWVSIAVQACEQRELRLDATVEALMRTAVALNDAFLSCWTWKYRSNLLRPVTYVNRYIDAGWRTVVNTPQFPEHTSGHSVASRAASTVLTAMLGSFPFDDTARSTTTGLVQRTRRWSDFTDAADTAAMSRLYGGIHYQHGIDSGKAQGDAVGALVLARLVTRR